MRVHRFSNLQIAGTLREMGELFDMEGVQFKPRAYERAALGVEGLDREATDIYKEGGAKALLKIAGVGAGIAAHMEELFTTGHFSEYERMKKRMPVDIAGLTAVEGVGPKMIRTLYRKLGVKNIRDLERVARKGTIHTIPGFGEKSEQKILKGIEFLKGSGGRRLLGDVLPQVRVLENMIRGFPETDVVAVAGSIRRRKETIGDIDILVTSKKPAKVMERFLGLSFIGHVYASGATKTMVRLKNGIDADLRVVPDASFGAALNYFTGSKEHNVALRERAIKKGYKLNEYGLYKGTRLVAGRTEGEIYTALGLQYIEPEMREMTGEIEAARIGPSGDPSRLPHLISYDDLKGDLQTQTNWTDGVDTIEAMAGAAMRAGLEYIVITDHTKTLAMTGGADEEKLRKQMAAIDAMNKKLQKDGSSFRILKGAEVNILKDGTCDINDSVLQELDVVGAAIHTHFKESCTDQTKRIIRAMENPHVDIIFHLTTRLINRRAPIELDSDAVIEAARRTGTVLEIDAFPDRLDIKDDYIKKCVMAGVKMSIDSDAHSVEHFAVLEYGIAQARRGWAQKKDIINAWPVDTMLGFLKDKRSKKAVGR